MNTTTNEKRLFPSLASLRAEHLDLLKRFRDEREADLYIPEIRDFIERCVLSGVFLDRDVDRQNAQSILDYWGSRLYRMTSSEVENILLEFDPSLAPDLEDALCPYLGLNAFGEEKSQLFFSAAAFNNGSAGSSPHQPSGNYHWVFGEWKIIDCAGRVDPSHEKWRIPRTEVEIPASHHARG